jgi:hypothetical protein
MISRLLLILIIILCQTPSRGFLKFNNLLLKRNLGIIPFSRGNNNLILPSTCFYDDLGDYKNCNNNNFNNNILSGCNISYTLIWFDCCDCKKLLIDIKEAGKEIFYINGSYYFFDENDAANNPLFYKNDDLIAMDLFSIYEELFYNRFN